MAVRLNITMGEDLFDRLKRATPPKRMSAFIAQAVKEKLRPGKAELDAAYKDASSETWRKRLAADWRSTEIEEWPD